MQELAIIQKTYDLILWYAPHLNRMPRDTKFMLGDRIHTTLYDLLEGLIEARYDPNRLPLLRRLNAKHIHLGGSLRLGTLNRTRARAKR